MEAGFIEQVAVETVAAITAAGTIGFIGFIASRRIWRTVRCQWRAASIRKGADVAFTIVCCPITDDNTGSIGNEIAIRLETAFRAFAGWNIADNRPFRVVQLPLELPNDEGTETYDQAVKSAKFWLENTDANILIWGKRVSDSVGFIRLIGKDRKKGIVEARRIDFDRQATKFDEALAVAIAYEAAALTQVTLSEPQIANLDALRDVSVKLRKLIRADAPALSSAWRERIAEQYRRLTEEIVRRTPDAEGRRALEEDTRAELAKLSKGKQPIRFAETALRIAILVRKRNWSDPNLTELDEADELLDEAAPIFESAGEIEYAAEVALERLLVRRQELVFFDKEKAESDPSYRELFSEATRLVKMTAIEGHRMRLTAASLSYPPLERLGNVFDFNGDKIASIFEFIALIIPHLDNGELLEFASRLDFDIAERGDELQNVELWRATIQVEEAIMASRESWTTDESLYLRSMIGRSNGHVAQRINRFLGANNARPYYDRAQRIAEEIDSIFDWRSLSMLRHVDLRTIFNFGYDIPALRPHSYDRAIAALRFCAGENARKFPRTQFNAREYLAVALNNYAVIFDSLEAAQEALTIIRPYLETQTDNMHLCYVAAFSAWQVARLTTDADLAESAKLGLRAHLMAERALERAIQKDDQAFISFAHDVLTQIEKDFPNLAIDLEATTGKSNSNWT